MIKNFWEEKKELIQIIAILIAVGALFLSIAPPKDEQAKNALFNIQLIWLIIITFTLIILSIHFAVLMFNFEKEAKKKYQIDLDETISILIFLIGIWMVINLWIYILNLYRINLLKLLSFINYIVISTILAFDIYCVNKITIPKKLERFPEKKVRNIIFFIVFSLSVSLWLEISLLKFSLSDWLKNSGIFFVIFFIADTIIHKLINYKKKKMAKATKQKHNIIIPILFIIIFIGSTYWFLTRETKIEIKDKLEYIYSEDFDPNQITLYNIGIGDNERKIPMASIKEEKNLAGWIHTIYDVAYRISNEKIVEIALHDSIIQKLGLLREDEIIIRFGEPDKIEEETSLFAERNYFYIDKGLIIRYSTIFNKITLINIIGK